ncbi:hypothetical protein PV08_11472 [Exophiala spinifera]|uniref:GrpB family protein n=1 Tax=Exophiala spinifera TaxID=91928 RepID=A0A0D2AUY7_9EURO|nr:uncharacterized protein PV08_11472 [Exophiala spinifera]KIW10508.1 hypothetical protein PV08_11472 [Exophiala spinifera]
MKVVVEEYNPQWAVQFQSIKSELEDILRGVRYISIEHVGSTSVPGLAAKPIIDLSIVSEAADVSAAIEALTSKGGYTYMGEMGIPDRHAFRNLPALPRRNLYLSVKDCHSIRNHLAVREVCQRDPKVRDAYGKAKLTLAERDWENVDEYCEAKNDILSWVLEKAGMSCQDRMIARQLNTTQ